MRFVFAMLAVGIIASSYLMCPRELREDISEAITPSDELAQNVSDALDTLVDYMRGPDEVA